MNIDIPNFLMDKISKAKKNSVRGTYKHVWPWRTCKIHAFLVSWISLPNHIQSWELWVRRNPRAQAGRWFSVIGGPGFLQLQWWMPWWAQGSCYQASPVLQDMGWHTDITVWKSHIFYLCSKLIICFIVGHAEDSLGYRSSVEDL